jgi:surfeit locus 1 family protein
MKQALWAEFERTPSDAPLVDSNMDSIERFARIALEGHFEPEHQFLLDNRIHAGQPGYEVLTCFRLASGARVL